MALIPEAFTLLEGLALVQTTVMVDGIHFTCVNVVTFHQQR
jgi:hypothetical protein